MIEVLVTRGAADSQGPDITDDLITSVPVALARGAAEINNSCSDRKKLTLDIVPKPFVLPGSLVRVSTHTGARVGQLKSMQKEYSLADSAFSATCQLVVEVAADG